MSLYCINLSRAQLTEIICHCERNHKMLNGRTQRGGPGNEWLHSLPPLLFCPSSSLGCAPARARSRHRGINCFFRLGGKCLLLPVLSLAFFFSTPSAPSLSLIGFTKLPSLNPFIKNHQSVSLSVSLHPPPNSSVQDAQFFSISLYEENLRAREEAFTKFLNAKTTLST